MTAIEIKHNLKSDTSIEVPLTRAEVTNYIIAKFGTAASVSKATLGKLAVIGGGPPFRRYGRRVAYLPSQIDAWVASRCSGPLNSTSDTGGNHA